MQFGFKMSPSTYNKSGSGGCNLFLYHHKILRSPPRSEPSLPPILGRFGHKGFELYTDRIDEEKVNSFMSPGDIAKTIIGLMPKDMDQKFIHHVVPHVVGFSRYEFNRLQRLRDLLGQNDEVFHWYKPVAQEYTIDDMTIGINTRVDVIYPIPPGLYGNHPACLEVGDYKTGKVPPCSHGLKTEKKTGKTTKVPIEMTDEVETQIMFGTLFLRHFGIMGIPDPNILFGKVIYTKDGTTVTQQVTEQLLEKVFEGLKKIQNIVETNGYSFNSWKCGKFHCDYEHVCLRSLKIDLAERALLLRLYKKDRDAAGQKLFNFVNEIHASLNAESTIEVLEEEEGESEW